MRAHTLISDDGTSEALEQPLGRCLAENLNPDNGPAPGTPQDAAWAMVLGARQGRALELVGRSLHLVAIAARPPAI
jgi:hypothetical protein